jgi:MFS transporter, FSR family, fosmidomycin resistance protein
MRLLRQPRFLLIALSHLMVDTLSGQVGILLAVLSVPLALSNAAIGLIAMLYSIANNATQPIVGWLYDRAPGRYSFAVGLIWMGVLFSLVAVLPGYWPLGVMILASLGSGMFHPMGTSQAADLGDRHMAGRVATAAAIFFLFGQGGWAIGPALGGLIIDHLGRQGILILAGVALAVGLAGTRWLRQQPTAEKPSLQPQNPAPGPAPTTDVTAFVVILLCGGIRNWAATATTTFIPKFYLDLGYTPTVFGLITALFMGSSAVGGVIGAVIADRYGKRRTILASLLLSVLPLYFFPVAHGAAIYVLVALAGLLNGAPHPVLVTMAQRALPGRTGFASGLTLGVMFAAGALGAYLSGLGADQLGLARVLQANAAITLLAALVVLGLRRETKNGPTPLLSAEG